MKPLYQPLSSELTVRYAPQEDTVLTENPPRFSWMPAKPRGCTYRLEVSPDQDFSSEGTFVWEQLPFNVYTPDSVFAPGQYWWRYTLEGEPCEWSQVRSFVLPDGLPETPLPTRKNRYQAATAEHPRLWLNPVELAELQRAVKQESPPAGWDEFVHLSVEPWLDAAFPEEPAPYPAGRVVELWRGSYLRCQELLYAVRHLAVAGCVLQDRRLLEKAKEFLLTAASWDPRGTTSRDYNDESSFRVLQALAWGYDWLYHELSDAERALVEASLLARLQELYAHVVDHSQVHISVFDSHAIRSVSWVMTLAGIALRGHSDLADRSLDYAIEYLSTVYSPWGDADGGWAEGGMYWTTAMAAVTEGVHWIRKHTEIDLFRRPFFQKTGDFPLYAYPQDGVRASFCDQSNLGELPVLKTGYLMRTFAGVTGNGHYQWYYEQVAARSRPEDRKLFFNWGWWDFPFDNLVYHQDFPAVQANEPPSGPVLKWFRGIGWAAMHVGLSDPGKHVSVITKCSPYGSVSHSAADQSSFLLHAYGEPLAVLSGHYVGFNTPMHRQWRRQTKAHNTLLIDGKGQYADMDKVLQVGARGSLEAEERGDHFYVRSDATQAYRSQVPFLEKFVRELYFVGGSYLVVVDSVDLSQPGTVDWRLHALQPFVLQDQEFRTDRPKAGLTGSFVHSSSGPLILSQTNEFEGVDPQGTAGLEPQWHLTARTPSARQHRIVTVLIPQKPGEDRYVVTTFDDQGHTYLGCYFIDSGHTLSILVPKGF